MSTMGADRARTSGEDTLSHLEQGRVQDTYCVQVLGPHNISDYHLSDDYVVSNSQNYP